MVNVILALSFGLKSSISQFLDKWILSHTTLFSGVDKMKIFSHLCDIGVQSHIRVRNT